MNEVSDRLQRADRDLLIRLDQQIIDLSARVERGFTEIKSSLMGRLESLECDKADRVEVEVLQKKVNDDIEKRVRILERWGAVAVGVLMAIEFILKFFIK